MVKLYDALLESNESTVETSYHLTGSIQLDGDLPAPLNLRVSASNSLAAPNQTALLTGQLFAQLYSNGARQGVVRPSVSTSRPFRGACRWNWWPRVWFKATRSTPAIRSGWKRPSAPGSSIHVTYVFPLTYRPG